MDNGSGDAYSIVFSPAGAFLRGFDHDRWHAGDPVFPAGPDPDGSGWMFAVLLDPAGDSHVDFARDYHETTIDTGAVAGLRASRRLTGDLLHRLNPALTPAALAPDLARIGWPALD